MPLISATIPNLINGVSQQPPPTRIPTACESATNSYMSVVSGLQKRQHSEYLSKLALSNSTTLTDPAIHLTHDSSGNKYVFVVTNDSGLQIFNLTSGSAIPLKAADDTSDLAAGTFGRYLTKTGTVPRDHLEFVTVADTTYVLNKSVTAGATDISETDRDNPDITCTVFIRRAVAKVNYRIVVENASGSVRANGVFETQDNTTAEKILEGTSKIAEELAKKMVAAGISQARSLGPLVIFPINATDRVKVEDQFGGAAMRVIQDSVQDFADLPPVEEEGRLVKVVGDADAEGDDYWVRYNGRVWVEDAAYNAYRKLDADTMPWAIKRKANHFTLEPVDWAQREVGDDESNPDPTFVGREINSMFLYKGRMGMLTDENLVMSEVSEYTNFWRTTATQLLDTERIDIASTTGRVNILRHAVAFGDSLVLFSDNQQFKVTQGDILSPTTVGLQPTTAYDGSRKVPPVNSGPNVFFAVDGPRFAIVREMYIDENNGEQFNAAEITIQVPKYIPSGVTQLAVSTYEDALVALSSETPNTLYIYKWFLEGKTKVQSSWSKWEFDPNIKIHNIGFLDQDLVMVSEVSGQLLIDRVRLEEAVALSNEHTLLIDHQVRTGAGEKLSASYDPASGYTTFTLPFLHKGRFQFWTTANPYGQQIEAFPGAVGSAAPSTDTAINTYHAKGDWTAGEMVVTAGLPYSFEFVFSDQFVRTNRGGGDYSIQDGRLQLRYMSVVYQNSSFFEAEVTPKNRPSNHYVFNARTLADSTNRLDTLPIETGEFRFPIFAQNTKVEIKLKSDMPFPCAFGVVEWDALYHPRTSRI